MGAKYDSGLYDANDLATAYTEGYDEALRKVMLKVKISCPLPLVYPYFNVQFFGYLTVDTLFDVPDELAQPTALSALVNELIQNTYKVIAWEHVARAFRADD